MCRELGYSHPNELLEHLTYDELQEWEAFDALEPIGQTEHRMEYMLGVVCSILVNSLVSIFSKKGSNPKQAIPSDFMPKWGVFEDEIEQDTPKQSVEEMKQLLLGMARVQNTRVKNIKERRKINGRHG